MKAVFSFQFLRIYKELAKNITFALPRNKKRIGETRSRPELGFRPFFLHFPKK